LSLVSAVVWAALIMGLVLVSQNAWVNFVGPSPWWTLLVPLALIVIFVRWLGHLPEHALAQQPD